MIYGRVEISSMKKVRQDVTCIVKSLPWLSSIALRSLFGQRTVVTLRQARLVLGWLYSYACE